jgi:hypothetical protein
VRRIESLGIKFRELVWKELNALHGTDVRINEVILDPERRL